jgi:AraC-like DNA-binding protein
MDRRRHYDEQTPALPLTRAGGLQPLVHFLRTMGAPLGALLAKSRIPRELIEEADTLIPLHLVHRFIGMAASTQGVDDLGVVLAARTSAFDLHLIGPRLKRAITVYDYIQCGSRSIGSVCSGERFWLTLEGGEVRFHHYVPGFRGRGREHEDLFCVAVTVRMLRQFAGEDWSPREMSLMTAERSMLGDGSLFGNAEIRLGSAHSSFTMPVELLLRPIPEHLREQALPDTGTGSEGVEMPGDFLRSVEALIASLLTAGCLDMDLVAESSSLSRRTLQRRLQRLGLSYSEIVQRARLRLARDWLRQTRMPVSEIAATLGYSDPANFTRAFRRVCGMPPLRYRASLH